jgi:hypothetical protein
MPELEAEAGVEKVTSPPSLKTPSRPVEGPRRLERLHLVLQQLRDSDARISGAAVLTRDGLIVAGSVPEGADEMRFAVGSAEALDMAYRAAGRLDLGPPEEVIVQGSAGYAILTRITSAAVLLACAAASARLGSVVLDVRAARAALAEVLEER